MQTVTEIEVWYHEKALTVLENTNIPPEALPLIITLLNKERMKKLEEIAPKRYQTHQFDSPKRAIKSVAISM